MYPNCGKNPICGQNDYKHEPNSDPQHVPIIITPSDHADTPSNTQHTGNFGHQMPSHKLVWCVLQPQSKVTKQTEGNGHG